MFYKKGVQIFTPDKAPTVKSIPPEKIYEKPKNSNSSTRVCCDFYDVFSDGKKARPISFPFFTCSVALPSSYS